MWEGWEAGFMTFMLSTLCHSMACFSRGKCWINRYAASNAGCRTRHEMLIGTHRLSLSALEIWYSIWGRYRSVYAVGSVAGMLVYRANTAERCLGPQAIHANFSEFRLLNFIGKDSGVKRMKTSS
jgi:hypothetical protein